MRLHWAWAALIALALGAGAAWWTRPAGKTLAGADTASRPGQPRAARSHADGGPVLYRWIDAHGVVNITTAHPPPGRRFSIVRIDPNQNVVPLSHGDSASKAATKPR